MDPFIKKNNFNKNNKLISSNNQRTNKLIVSKGNTNNSNNLSLRDLKVEKNNNSKINLSDLSQISHNYTTTENNNAKQNPYAPPNKDKLAKFDFNYNYNKSNDTKNPKLDKFKAMNNDMPQTNKSLINDNGKKIDTITLPRIGW